MGMNSVIMICNDCIHAIEKDPAGWWRAAWEAIRRGKLPKHFGFGNCGGAAFSAVLEQHADMQSLVVFGGNYATVIWSGHRGNEPHHTKEQIVKLLKAAASKYGYRLVKKAST